MYEMPLTCVWGFGFWGWGDHSLFWGFGCWRFVIGVLPRDPKFATIHFQNCRIGDVWRV